MGLQKDIPRGDGRDDRFHLYLGLCHRSANVARRRVPLWNPVGRCVVPVAPH